METCCGQSDKYKNADYSNPAYAGADLDPALSKGALAKRSCTDILCCIIFVLYWGVIGYCGYMGV